MRGFFYGFGVCSSVSYWHLSSSPELHQNFEGSTPELCSGDHQKGCDLEGVEGATPQTPHTSLTQLTFQTMTAFNTDYNTNELLDQELTTAELTELSGGNCDTTNTVLDPGFNNLHGVIGEIMLKAAKELLFPTAL